MESFENTYCDITELNKKRYHDKGWHFIDVLCSGNDYLVARVSLGREVSYTVSKYDPEISRYKKIENDCQTNPENFAVTFAPENQTIMYIDSSNSLMATKDKIFSLQDVEKIIEHILSFQHQPSFTGPLVYVDNIIDACKMFKLNPKREGRNINF